MSKDLSMLFFDFLRTKLGEEVICTAWQFGQEVEHVGILEEVLDFDQIVVGKTVIPFVGNGLAIEKVKLSKGGMTLYNNPEAIKYETRDPMGVMLAQESMLGYSILRDQLTNGPKKTLTNK